jgi:putative SOS response-associated peptidase YedK
MCGRYGLAQSAETLVDILALGEDVSLTPRFNIAPTQPAPVVRDEGAGRVLAMMHWGLVPSWSRDTKRAARMINARSESVAEKPSFRAPFRSRRCLVPTDGWFEWQGKTGSRAPYWVQRPDAAPFVMAGLWDRWSAPDGYVLDSFTVLTMEACPGLRPLHHRMPLVLRPEDYEAWLQPSRTPEAALTDLVDRVPTAFEFFAVSLLVNYVANDVPQCRLPRLTLPL